MTRTPDLLVRSQTLYPTELRAHITSNSGTSVTLVRYAGPVKTPVETEVKISVPTAAGIRRKLHQLGFKIGTPRQREQNTVLDDAQGGLRANGLLLRVRLAGKTVLCTFKGPEAAGRIKKRVEREFEASNFDECVALFGGLGFQQTFYYEKFRTEFQRSGEPGHVTLDETPIGVFIELEGAPRWIASTSRELGFAPDDWINRSYAFLYFQWQAEMGGDATAMRFPKSKSKTK